MDRAESVERSAAMGSRPDLNLSQSAGEFSFRVDLKGCKSLEWISAALKSVWSS